MMTKLNTVRFKVIIFTTLLVLTSSFNFPLGAEPVSVFYTDFERGVPYEFTGITTIEDAQGYESYGFDFKLLRNSTGGSFGGGGSDGVPGLKTRLTLTDLPKHNSINIGFLLAIIDSWDGSYSTDRTDVFNVSVDGTIIFSETFSNRPPSSWVQTYNPPDGGLLTPYPFSNLGFRDIYGDSAYNMGLDATFRMIEHTGDTLVLDWFATGNDWEGGLGESWAIDNVRVEIVTAETKQYKLKVKKAKKNKGDGIVTSDDGNIACGESCSYAYHQDTLVTLSAEANEGSTFIGWKPATLNCIGTGSCTVTIDKAKTVQAVFIGDYTLKVTSQGKKKGSGTVISLPVGINCTTGSKEGCAALYGYGEAVTLTSSAGDGSTFLGWAPAKLCPGTGVCIVPMDKKRSVKAIFSGQ